MFPSSLPSHRSHIQSNTHLELHFAGAGLFVTRGKVPHRLQVSEEVSISAHRLRGGERERGKVRRHSSFYDRHQNTERRNVLFPHPNFAIGDEGEVRGVALHQRRESNFQLGLKVPRLFLDEAGLPAPGHKVLVLVHVGHHVVQLLRRIPRTNQAVGGGGESSSTTLRI